jgi:hypothetical protein
MKASSTLIALAILTLPLMADTPKGTVPRSMASKYSAHTEAGGALIGASLLKPQEVHKVFSTDLSRCCVVVEVALYPAKDKPIEVFSDDFVLRLEGTDTAVKPSSATLLAAQLQKKNENTHDVAVNSTVYVGYESGTDPLTGQRVHGVETAAGVGVGVGGNPGAAPASTDRDRDVMELELSEKGLPQDTASAPVAGYLYFSLPKGTKKATHQLEYTLNGQKVLLKLD